MFAMSDQMLPIYGKWKSSAELAPSCPRCASVSTKFCYYNNYSLSQPRYFCKGCRRYWTKGGSLRNVPVGGGFCKTRRGKSSRADKNRLPMTYSKNSTTFGNQEKQIIGTSSSSDGDYGNQPGPVSTGSDIDLAAIFAQFVNHSTSSDQPGILSQEWPNEGIDAWSFLQQDSNSQNDSSMEVPVVHPIPESYMLQENDQTNAFGLQNVLADEMVHDVFWSNYAADTPSFECQPMVQQLQQFGSFPVDDQLKISANLLANNWSFFDLSGFDLYSKP